MLSRLRADLRVIADAAYDSVELRERLAERGSTLRARCALYYKCSIFRPTLSWQGDRCAPPLHPPASGTSPASSRISAIEETSALLGGSIDQWRPAFGIDLS
jgi:hypothetical protein